MTDEMIRQIQENETRWLRAIAALIEFSGINVEVKPSGLFKDDRALILLPERQYARLAQIMREQKGEGDE